MFPPHRLRTRSAPSVSHPFKTSGATATVLFPVALPPAGCERLGGSPQNEAHRRHSRRLHRAQAPARARHPALAHHPRGGCGWPDELSGPTVLGRKLPDRRPHGLRHTNATLLVPGGAVPTLLQVLPGPSASTFTARRHVIPALRTAGGRADPARIPDPDRIHPESWGELRHRQHGGHAIQSKIPA